MATASGAETVKAVVVREADGWSEADARGLGATENLREGHGTIKNVVDAVDSLGADRVAELAGWHQANGSREFASTIRKGLAVAQKAIPDVKTALAEGKLSAENAYAIAQVLSMERVGEGWEDAQLHVTNLMERIGPEELNAVVFGLHNRLAKGEKISDWEAAIAEERAKYNEKKGGKPGQLDSDAVLMETEDHELKTLGELEAELGDNRQPTTDNLDVGGRPSDVAPELAAAEGAGQNKAVALQPVAGKPGTFATLSHPKARFTVDGEKKVVAVDGLTAEDFAPGRGESAAALVARVEAYAAENGLKIGFYDDAVEAAWNRAKERIKAEAAERVAREQLKETTNVVIGELQKSFPGSEVVRSIEEFNAKTGRKLTTADGQVYGIVDPETGHVYLNPEIFGTRIGLETPIHEFGHLGIIECEKVNKPVYDRGVKLASGFLENPETAGDGAIRKLVDFVNETYADHSAKGKAEELMAQLIGKRGAEALKAETNQTVVAKIKAWLVEFWNTFGKALGLKDITPEEAAKMTFEQVADAIRAEMMSGQKYGVGLKGVEFTNGGARVVTKPVRIRKKLTGRRKAVNEFVNRMGGADDPANTETDLLALWVDNGGRLFNRMPFEVETSYSKGATGIKETRRAVADEFTESTAFYRDLDPAQRRVFFGNAKLEMGPIGEGLKNALEAAGITRFTNEDGTVDYDAVIDEFKRQWTNYERGEEFLKERNEWQEERERAYVEEMERAEQDEYEAVFGKDEASAALSPEEAAAQDAQIAADIAAGRFSRRGPMFSRSSVKPWPEDFPKVGVHTTLGAIKGKYGELHKKAKAGDREAAADLIEKIVKPERIKALAARHPNAIVVPVHAEEMSGRNQLPRKYADYIGALTGLKVDDGIVQTVRANHTGSNAADRLTRRAEFGGEIEKGAEYILVDDHITQGGTLNELRHYIENNGGKVVEVTTLTASQNSTILSVSKSTVDSLVRKFGNAAAKAISSDAPGDRGSPQGLKGVGGTQPPPLGASDSGQGKARQSLEKLLADANVVGNLDALTENEARYLLKFSPEKFVSTLLDAREPQTGAGAQGGRKLLFSRFAGEKGAENMGVGNANHARSMESAGADREKIWRETGWWKGKDGKWRFELPNVERFKPVKMRPIDGAGYGATVGELIDAPHLFDAYPGIADVPVVVNSMMGSLGKVSGRNGKHVIALAPYAYTSGGNGENLLNAAGREAIIHEIQHVVQDIEGFAKGGSIATINEARDQNNKLSRNVGDMMRKSGYEKWMDGLVESGKLVEVSREAREKNGKTKFPMERAYAEQLGGEDGAFLIERLDRADEIYADNSKDAAYGQTAEEAYRSIAGEVEARNASRREAMTPEERAATPPWETEDVPQERQLLFSRKGKQKKVETKYSYDSLTAKPAMKVPSLGTVKTKTKLVNGKFLLDTDDILHQAVGNIEAGDIKVDGKSAVHVADLGRDVVVDFESLRHTKPQAIAKFPDVYANYGRILASSIVVNEASPADPKRAVGEYVAVGMAFNRRGRPVFVRSVIDSRNGIDKISRTEVVYAVDAQKGNPAFQLHANGLAGEGQSRAHVDDGIKPSSVSKSETEVSIADFLAASKGVFRDVFSRDVNEKLEVERDTETKLGKSLLYARAPEAEHVKLTRIADDAGQGEQTPGAIAASTELMRQAPTPLTQKGTRYVSLPLSELHALSRYLTGHAMPAEMESGKKLGKAGKASLKHRKLTIAADVLGVVDKTDAAAETATLKQHGFFKHEDANWCATHSPTEVRQERARSEDALSSRLEALADRRIAGKEPGGNAAGRKVFADQLAKVVMAMPHGQPGVLGAMQTVAGALEKRVKGSDAEADAFIKWMNGGAPGGRALPNGAAERKTEMFAAFLIMPKEMEARAKGWYDAIRSTIAADQKLADTFRKMTARSMSEQGYKHLETEILRMQDAQTEAAIKKLQAEANEPIKAGGKLDQAKETVVLACDDRMGAAVVRVDAAAKVYLAAQKKLMAAAKTPAEKAQIKQQTDLFMGQLAQAKNQAELSRTAWERGRDNADARYLWRMVDLLNEATVRDGLKTQDLSLYLDQMRVIETRGLSGSRGESARQAQLVLDAMRRRLGGDFAKVEAFARKFHAIHEQELLNNPLLEKILGKGTADYWRSQTSYVTTKRTFSPEELAEIEAARRVLAASGAAGGDTVVGQMFKFCGRPEATAKLKGSFADKQEVMSATFEKVAEVQRFLRRSEYVIQLRDMLKLANVEGVHDLPAGKNEFKSNARYGSIGYMENGHRRVLVVPKEIARGFERQAMYDTGALRICAAVNNIARQLWIDWNPVYWQRNISRNAGSIEMNMPGMRESIVKRGARFVFPGLAPVTEMAMTHLVRHMPERMSLPLRRLWGEHTALFYAPKAKRMAMWITDHSEMQRRLWIASRDSPQCGTQCGYGDSP